MTARHPKAIMILGASGYLGRNLLDQWKDADVQLIAVTRSTQKPDWLSSIASRALHLTFNDIRDLNSLRPHICQDTVIVNCIALANHTECNRAPEESHQINAEFPAHLASFLKDNTTRWIHISTDGLFSNRQLLSAPAYFSKEEPVEPLNIYAKTKRAAEKEIERANWGHIFRVSFVGPDLGTQRGLLHFLKKSLIAQPPIINGYDNNWFTPLHVKQLAKAILFRFSRMDSPEYSLEHLGTDTALTKYDFLKQVAIATGHPFTMKAAPQKDTGGNTPLDQSLKNDFPLLFETKELISLSATDISRD